MDIGKAFEDAWKLFVKDAAPLIIGALIVLVLSIVSLGILAGPLWGGLYRMVTRRVREGRPADFGDVFSAFDRFWTLFAAALVIGILVALGLVFLILPGLLLAAIWLYVPLFVVDRGMGLGDAMRASRELVSRAGLWEHVGLVLVIAVITILVGNITGIGFLLTWPLTVTLLSALYFRLSGESALVAAAIGGGGAPAAPAVTPTPGDTAAGAPQQPPAGSPQQMSTVMPQQPSPPVAEQPASSDPYPQQPPVTPQQPPAGSPQQLPTVAPAPPAQEAPPAGPPQAEPADERPPAGG